MKTMSIAVAVLAVVFLSACGSEDVRTCDSCLAQQSQSMDPDGCWPYCEGPPDGDGDGIDDEADACPSSSETVNGYQDDDGCPDSTPNALTIGTWTGSATISSDSQTFVYTETVVVANGSQYGQVVISESCPVGGPSVATSTTDNTATWTGQITCPNVSLPWCDVTAMHHEIVSVSVGTDGYARIHINGHADGCGRSGVPYSVVLLGSR